MGHPVVLIFAQSLNGLPSRNVLGLASENCSRGYENMVKSLSKLKKDASTDEDTTANEPNNNTTYANAGGGTKLVTPYRYQTITFETMGYSGANVDVRPYGIAKYHFVAEFDNELGLNEGDMVYLVRYVDNEWLEAEIDTSRRQVFITTYLDTCIILILILTFF